MRELAHGIPILTKRELSSTTPITPASGLLLAIASTARDCIHSMITLRDVSFVYPAFSLGPLDLELPRGARCALVGRNGAGKTTMLALIAGQLSPTKGSIALFGTERSRDLLETKQRVALVSLDAVGCPWMTVRDHLSFLANFYAAWSSSRAEALADALDVPMSSRLGTLSRGTALKVSLCAAWGQGADLLLLDEPTAGLDPVARHELLQQLDAYLAGHPEMTVIVATHILEDLDAIKSTHLFALTEGRGRTVPLHERQATARLSDIARQLLIDGM